MARRHPVAAALLGYFLVSCLFGWELLHPHRSLFRWDTLVYNWPVLLEARAQFLAGHMPFWASSFCCGTPLLENINDLTKTAEATLNQATSTLSTYEEMGTEGSPFVDELTTALEELTRTARSLRILLESVESRPDEFLRGKSSGGGTR